MLRGSEVSKDSYHSPVKKYKQLKKVLTRNSSIANITASYNSPSHQKNNNDFIRQSAEFKNGKHM